jgi:hypothetical protein
MPRPVKKRSAASTESEGAAADNSEAMAKMLTLPRSSGLRPIRSPIGPATSAPTMMPMFEKRKASAKTCGARFHACVNSGTAQPIEPTS